MPSITAEVMKTLAHIGEALDFGLFSELSGNTEGSPSTRHLVMAQDPVTTEDESPRDMFFNVSNTPVPLSIGWYLSGYADGEGCFCVSFSPRRTLKIGVEVRPSFSVSQNGYRSEVLTIFKNLLGCGTIRPDRSDKTYKFEVRSLDDLLTRVIPFFLKFPLQSSKRSEFLTFSCICELMSKKSHTTSDGLKEIVELAVLMNGSDFRRYHMGRVLQFMKR